MKYIIKNIIPAAALALASTCPCFRSNILYEGLGCGSHRSQPLHRAEP